MNSTTMTFQAVITDLESRGIMPDRAPSLVKTSQGLERIGYFQSDFYKRSVAEPDRVIVVAGTNGKGSVSATLEALFLSAGERTGLYTSPHLMDITERIRLSGQDISAAQFVRSFMAVDEVTRDLKLTHFETVTLMAVWYFCVDRVGERARVDRLILEVGMGGTWDSTNAVPHGVCVITSIGIDHAHLLGSTRSEIASQKLGIVPEKNTLGTTQVIHFPVDAEIQGVWDAKRQNANATWVERVPYQLAVENVNSEPRYILSTQWGQCEIVLAGERGAMNTALALTVFSELGFDPKSHLPSLKRVSWPGRMEKIAAFQNVPIYLSGDHNPEGVKSLLNLLPQYPRRHLHVLLGLGKDKDLGGVLAPFFKLKNTSVYLTETPFKGRVINDYGIYLLQARSAWADPIEALEEVEEIAEPGDMILVTGSLYLVGDLRKYILLRGDRKAKPGAGEADVNPDK